MRLKYEAKNAWEFERENNTLLEQIANLKRKQTNLANELAKIKERLTALLK